MTTTETSRSWSERLNPRNWTLVWKLAVVGLLPAVLALVLGVLRVADQAGDAADLGRSTRLLEVQQQVSEAASALRGERDEATLFVAETRATGRDVLEIGFGKADIEIGEMLTTVRGATELDATTISALQQAESQLSVLSVLRGDVTDNAAAGVNQVRGRYTQVIGGVDVLDRALLRQLRTPGTAGLADALTAVTSANEQLAIQHTVLGTAIRAKTMQLADINTVTATDNQLTADYREYQVALTPEQLSTFGNFLDDAANSQRDRLKLALLATPSDGEITLEPFEWDTAYNGSRAAADRSAQMLRTELVNTSVAAEQAASNNAGIQSVVLMLGLLAGITVAILVARALIRSLRVLRTAALDVAERRLPQAVESMRAGETPDVTVDSVPITTSDEVGQVARAFDAVHGQAVRLAAEQAALQQNVSAMFVNLSRRSQALVERQLQLIEQLESNEQDPDQLSNLFQLDHLATRMRRNSENLLVLAGTDLAKRNAAPIPLVDVLRAAVSEVEQYQRVVVQSPPTATVAGRAGADLVHLLAELLDNATNFSPPDSQVVMSSARTPDGSVVVEISDRGVGMVEHELVDANHRLAGPSSVDVSASRRMGLFVVGRLGARHGISVRLGTSTAGQSSGLTASVTVPAYLISQTPGSSTPRPFGQPAQATPNGLPQRVANGSGVNSLPNGSPNGSLSALVAGTDGPSNPTSVFDAQTNQASGGFPLGAPPPAANGNPHLPTRRPGSTLRPDRDGPPLPPEAERGQNGPPEQSGRSNEDRARDIAEQARLDQESAARRTAASMRQDQHRPEQHRPDQSRTDQHRPDNRQDAQPYPGSGADPRFFQGGQNGNGGFGNGGFGGEGFGGEGFGGDGFGNGHGADGFGSGGNGSSPGMPPAGQDRDRDRGPQARDTGPATPPRPLPAQPSNQPSNQQPDDDRGDPPAEGGSERRFTGNPLPRRVPGTSPQPPRRPPNDPTDDGRPRSLHPSDQAPRQRPEQPAQAERPQPEQPRPESRPESRPDRPLPELPQRVPASELPRREPRSVPPGGPRPFSGAQSADSGGADELFAPVVPAEPQPDGPPAGRRPAPAPAAAAAAAPEQRHFDPTETTPIFEEIASAWFRSNRQIPVEYDSEQTTAQAAVTPGAAAAPAPAPVAAPSPVPSPVATEVERPAPQPEPQSRPQPLPQAQPEPEPVGATAGRAERGFATEADDGWRAARGAVEERASELTTAGLPKRRPRARLIPGSAGSAVLAAPASSPARSAENIRGRLASYQQGVRQGREQRLRGGTATPNGSGSNGGNDPAGAGGNHDEESS